MHFILLTQKKGFLKVNILYLPVAILIRYKKSRIEDLYIFLKNYYRKGMLARSIVARKVNYSLRF